MLSKAPFEFVGTVKVPAMSRKFVAKDKFVLGNIRKTEFNISYRNFRFIEEFLLGDGKIKKPISEQTLQYYRVKDFLTDDVIIKNIGGKLKAETTLYEMFSLIENGVFSDDGNLNIFYILNSSGVLRKILVTRKDNDYTISAHFVASPSDWRAEGYVFFRNSILRLSGTSTLAQV